MSCARSSTSSGRLPSRRGSRTATVVSAAAAAARARLLWRQALTRAVAQGSSGGTTRTGLTATTSSRASSGRRTRLPASWKVRRAAPAAAAAGPAAPRVAHSPALVRAAATAIDVNAPEVVEPSAVQTVRCPARPPEACESRPRPRGSGAWCDAGRATDAAASVQIFESITLEDVHQGASKTVSLGGRAMTYTVQPGFTSGSTLVFKDDGSGIGPLSFLFCRDRFSRLISRFLQARYGLFWSKRSTIFSSATAAPPT